MFEGTEIRLPYLVRQPDPKFSDELLDLDAGDPQDIALGDDVEADGDAEHDEQSGGRPLADGVRPLVENREQQGVRHP